MKCPVMSFEVSMGLVWLWAACILMLCSWVAGELVWYILLWLLGGAWFKCRYGGFWMRSCRLMFPGVRSFLVFSSFGFKPPASGFQSYSYSSLRLLHPYSTDDKTSRLMVKRFSTVRATQRGSQSYIEKRRGRRKIEVSRKRIGEIKRGERNLASNQFPMCSPQSWTPREVHGVT